MISITRERRMALEPALIYALLANPHNLPRILPRITRVDPGQAQGAVIPLTIYFQTDAAQRPAQGTFRTILNQEVSFECSQPLPVLARWTLQPLEPGTLLTALLEFDLKPLLGPLALMTPTLLVKRQVGIELEQTLELVEELGMRN